MAHVDVEDLPISRELKDDILAWDSEFQATFDNRYPPDSGFASADLEATHIEQGKALAARLRMELGDGYVVEYRS